MDKMVAKPTGSIDTNSNIRDAGVKPGLQIQLRSTPSTATASYNHGGFFHSHRR